MNKRRFLATAASLMSAIAMPVLAQPRQRPIRLIVGFPPGQATELIARVVADELGHQLGQPIIVENKPGQGGSIALGAVAHAPADGSVITVSALAAYAINPYLYKRVPYDTLKDFAPIGLIADIPTVLVTGANSGIHTFADLIARAKANPGKVRFSSSGYGTVSHLGMQELMQRAGLNMIHVPYRGSGPAMTDLAGGVVEVGLDSIAATRPLVESGRLVALAAASKHRLFAFPDVPTFAELGYPGLEVSAWTAMSVPAGTPAQDQERLSKALYKIVSSSEFAARMKNLGAIARPGTSEEFAAFLRSEMDRWRVAVAKSGATVE